MVAPLRPVEAETQARTTPRGRYPEIAQPGLSSPLSPRGPTADSSASFQVFLKRIGTTQLGMAHEPPFATTGVILWPTNNTGRRKKSSTPGMKHSTEKTSLQRPRLVEVTITSEPKATSSDRSEGMSFEGTMLDQKISPYYIAAPA